MGNEPIKSRSQTDWRSALIGSAAGALGTALVGLIFSSTTLNFIQRAFIQGPFPQGVVVFVAGSECGAVGEGWKKFDLAAGRFVVGAGSNSDYPSRRFEPSITSKGAIDIRLAEKNLPPFNVQLPNWQWGIGVGGGGGLPTVNGFEPAAKPFSASALINNKLPTGGTAEPIEILPPSIALTACQRS